MRLRILPIPALLWPLAACSSPRPPPEMPSAPLAPAREPDPVRAVADKTPSTLDELLQLAEEVHPQLAIEKKNVDLAAAELWEARLYPNPQLELNLEDYRTRDQLSLGRSKRTIGLGVPLVIGGRIGAESAAAEARRDAAAIHFVGRRRQILGGVKRAFVELLAARARLDLAQETRDLARAFRDAATARFEAQAIPQMEVLKASVNLARTESDVASATKQLAVAEASLRAAVGRPDLALTKIDGELPRRFAAPDLESLRAEVLARHPLLEEAERTQEAASRELDAARAGRVPDLGFQIAAGRDPEDDTIVQAGLTIPLGVFNRNQARIEAASLRLDQSRQRIAAAQSELSLAVEERVRTLQSAQQRVVAYDESILPDATLALQQTQEGYRLGKFGLLDVLDAQRTLAEARAVFAASVAELNLAATDLETLTGSALEAAH